MTEGPQLYPDILRSRASAQPENVALVVDGAGAITYGEWERRSNAFARGLVARGIGPGEVVGLLFGADQWADYAVAFLGTLKAGAVAVPIPRELPPSLFREIAEHCGAATLCCPVGSAVADVTLRRWHPADLEEGQERGPFQVAVDPAQTAQILYTSGTTGTPKGVVCSHANLLFGIVTDGPELAYARLHHVALHALPVGVNASQIELTRAAHRLATMVVLPVFDEERFAALVAEHRPTVILLVPAMVSMILNAAVFERHDVSSLRRVRLTGAPSPPALLKRLAAALPWAEVVNEYALTESTPAALTTSYDPARPGSLGRPAPGSVRIVDGDRTSPPGTIGEVWLSSGNAPTRSYYREPAATAATFADSWIRTGDMGYLDEEGFFFLTDRADDVIITGGYNVSSLEVEGVLHNFPGVADVAVIGIPHDVLGQYVAALVVLRAPTTAATLKSFVGQSLPAYAVPQTIVFVDRLPRTVSGKVAKREVRARVVTERRGDFVAPRTRLEEALAAAWAELLGLEAVSVDDRFVDLGGQSISAARLLADLNRRYGLSLQPTVLAEAETVATLASVVEGCLVAKAYPRIGEHG